MKKSIYISLLLSFALSFWVYYLLRPVIYDDNTTYFLRPGTSNKKFIADLTQRGMIQWAPLFWAYILPQRAQIKTGEYAFPKGASLVGIWRQVTNGYGLVNHSFTIVPGWTFHQLREELDARENLKHITAKLNETQIMKALGSDRPPEGLFSPETFHYTRGVADLVILKRAYDLMQSQLREAWKVRHPDLPYQSAYEALIAASLIEKESAAIEERPLIASVLVNRLRKNMLLQFDPTIIYGLGKRYSGKLYKSNLAENSPYNTYLNKGLPPTPIAMSSLSAIEAALHPKSTDYFYFVAKGDGTHQFSKTLIEHQAAVNRAAEIKNHTFLNENFFVPYLQNKIDLQKIF